MALYHYELEYGYHYNCEKCGKEVKSTLSSGRLERSGILPDSMSAALAAADIVVVEKQMMARVEDKTYRGIWFSDTACPHCGARQSWCPPRKPEKPGGIGTAIAMGIFFAFGGALAGMVPGLIIYLLTERGVAIPVCLGVGAVLGIIVSIWSGRKVDAKDAETYPQRLKEYNTFMEDMKTRTVKGEPIVDWGDNRIRRCD